MTEPFARLRRFLRELKRRNVYRVAVMYAAVAFVGFQAAQMLIPATRLPAWADEFFLFLLVIGFPVALVLAWAFEMTAEGVRRTPTVGEEPAGTPAYPWVGLALVVLAAAGVWWVTARGPEGSPPGAAVADSAAPASGVRIAEAAPRFPSRDRPFVAVLPLENLSPREENAYFAAGIHEEILTQLSKVSGLGVFARTTMRQYEDTDRSISEIGRELGAEAVLEGSVRRAGDRVKITVQLIDPRTRDHLWSESYERRLDDIFGVQAEIARRVTGELEATLSPEEEQRIGKRRTESPAAYDLYLRGRQAYNRYEKKANEEAIRLFRQALDRDPEFALPWAGLGDALAQRVSKFGYPTSWADSAVRAARRAVELDPELAEAHKALGLAHQVQGELRSALDAYLRAVELDPNHSGAVNNVGSIYLDLGRLDEAVRWLRRSARLEPTSRHPRVNLAYTYTFLDLNERAEKWLEGALALDPDVRQSRLLRGVHAVYGGDDRRALSVVEEIVRDRPGDAFARTGAAGVAYMAREFGLAVEYARESLRLAPDDTFLYWHFARTLLGVSLMKSGEEARGRDVLQRAVEDYERRIREGNELYEPRWDLAAAHAVLGHREAAREWLGRAYDAGFRFARWPKMDPAFDGLRDDPGIRELVDRMEAEILEMRRRVEGSRPEGR